MSSQEQELAAVKRKIRAALSKKVEAGATAAEADTALRIVGELLETFNLNLNEVLVTQQAYVSKSYRVGGHMGVLGEVLVTLGRFTDTKVWYSRTWDKMPVSGKYEKRMVMNFFGMESDVDMALYLCDVIKSAHDRAYADYKKTNEYFLHDGHRKTLASNFTKGFASRINRNMNDIYHERKKKEKEAAAFHAEQMKDHMIPMSDEAAVKVAEMTTGTALMVIDKAEVVEDEFAKLGMTLITKHRPITGTYNGASRNAGGNAANSVNLSRPVNGGGRIGGYLK